MTTLLIPGPEHSWLVRHDDTIIGEVYLEQQTGHHDLRAHQRPSRYGRGKTRWVNSRNNSEDFTSRAAAVDDLIRIHDLAEEPR